MAYLVQWIALIVVTLVASFAAFFWALRSGQFEDQKRAAYFPLSEAPPENGEERPAWRIAELYVLGFACAAFLAGLVIAFVLGGRVP